MGKTGKTNKKTGEKKRLDVLLPVSEYEKLRDISFDDRMTISEKVRKLIEDEIKRKWKEK